MGFYYKNAILNFYIICFITKKIVSLLNVFFLNTETSFHM
jgi:hypothetical protein